MEHGNLASNCGLKKYEIIIESEKGWTLPEPDAALR
jgi:hypothetical protein